MRTLCWMDGLLLHPMLDIIRIMATAGDTHHGHAQAVLRLYVQERLGDPPGSYPTAVQLEHDPVGAIRDFAIATKGGTHGGVNPDTNANWIQARAWARRMVASNRIYRGACKHIWETIVATFSAGLTFRSDNNRLGYLSSCSRVCALNGW